jgi:hypothetical protein
MVRCIAQARKKIDEPDAGLEPATVLSRWRLLKIVDERNLNIENTEKEN